MKKSLAVQVKRLNALTPVTWNCRKSHRSG